MVAVAAAAAAARRWQRAGRARSARDERAARWTSAARGTSASSRRCRACERPSEGGGWQVHAGRRRDATLAARPGTAVAARAVVGRVRAAARAQRRYALPRVARVGEVLEDGALREALGVFAARVPTVRTIVSPFVPGPRLPFRFRCPRSSGGVNRSTPPQHTPRSASPTTPSRNSRAACRGRAHDEEMIRRRRPRERREVPARARARRRIANAQNARRGD